MKLALLATLAVAELLAIIAAYQVFADIECRLTGVESACRLLRSMTARGLAVAAALGLYACLRPQSFAGLARRARNRPPAPAWPVLHGLGVALIFLPLPLFGAAGLNSNFAPALAIMSLGGALAAAGGLFWAVPPRGWLAWLKSGGAALFLVLGGALLVPDLALLLEPLWYVGALTNVTFALVHLILQSTGAAVWADLQQHVIGLDGFNVRIGSPCSGVEGLVLVTVFMGFYALLMRGSLRQARFWLVLYPLVLLASWAFNVARIAGLIMIGAWVSPGHALNGFHSYAGWLMFTLLALAVLVAVHRLRWLQAKPAAEAEEPLSHDPVAARIVPFIAMMVSGIIASAFWTDPEAGYPLRCLFMAVALWWALPALKRLEWRITWTDLLAGAAVGVGWLLTAPDAAPAEAAVPASLTWILFRVLGTTLLVPLIEELFFRGYVLARLDGDTVLRRLAALAISSALFGLLHGRFAAGVLAGAVFGILMLRSGRVSGPVAAHALANAVIAAWAAITSNWQLI
ncbi:exosortase E/protease, VPEID-CTERM system [Roseobacteraceae bacterium NS-SX3]